MPIIAVDIGGTKTIVAHVEGSHLVESIALRTDRNGTPERWLESIKSTISAWHSGFDGMGFAVTGRVVDGTWSALNRMTLNIVDSYPLSERVKSIFGFDPVLLNDAQAAALGEHALGAGKDTDMVFLSVSTGVGGGIIINGDVVKGAEGLAGHFGQVRDVDGERIEDKISGKAMERQARTLGHEMTAKQIFHQASAGVGWAESIIDASALRLARLCADIKQTLDPARIVIGGGVGLAPGYLERVKSHLVRLKPAISPQLCPAALGANAGILGIAALYNSRNQQGDSK